MSVIDASPLTCVTVLEATETNVAFPKTNAAPFICEDALATRALFPAIDARPFTFVPASAKSPTAPDDIDNALTCA